MTTNNVMIQLKGISVAYRLIRERPRTFQENIINYLKGKRVQPETLWALKGLSFDVNKGDCLGVIGHNGAGKSTLLKVISNVIKPLEGSIRVHGKLAPLIEISAGFDPELTARENIFLNTSILGFTRKEIESKFSNIIAFTELEDFINTPLKNFSSGMTARLGFSIATEVNPDILIVDEVLAVGDTHFKKKSKARILEFRKKGTTILFVSHNMGVVRQLCNKALWLDHGTMKMFGDTKEVIAGYRKTLMSST
jgi:ABC-2 type transport system ATP-binding protein/lipopolysaccharide transport system ATP-binding protein